MKSLNLFDDVVVPGTCEAEDFPTLGETVTLVWQQNSQNFVMTDVE